MSEPANQVILEGEVLPGREERWTPAGLPLVRFDLEHRTRATIAGLERDFRCRIAVVALGEELARCAGALADGQWCRVVGLLGQRVRQKGGEEPFFGRVEVHAGSLRPAAEPGNSPEGTVRSDE